MGIHVNRQLRDAVTVRLTGLATTGARVHPYRVNPLQALSELPALIVRTPSDSAQESTIHGPAIYERTVNLTVSAYVAGNANVDDAIDTVRNEVETALGTAVTTSGKPVQWIYESAETDEIGGESPVAELQMRFRAVVYHSADAPDVLL